MLYSEKFMNKILSSNLVSFISLFTKVRYSKKLKKYLALCPFHNSSTYSIVINVESNEWYCYDCGRGGNVISFIMELLDLDFTGAVDYLAKLNELPLEEDTKSNLDNVKSKTLAINEMACQFFQTSLFNSEKAQSYLSSRGIKKDTILKFRLGFADRGGSSLLNHLRNNGFSDDDIKDAGVACVNSEGEIYDRFRNRIIFPIMDANGRVIAFGGRILYDAKKKLHVAKYLNSPETTVFSKRKALYGIQDFNSSNGSIIICEGYMDVLAFHQAGFRNAVAGLGTALTDFNCHTISEMAGRVILCYDSDKAGRKATRRAISKFQNLGISTDIMSLDPYKDPDEALKAEGRDYITHKMITAIPCELYLTKEGTYDPQSTDALIKHASKNLARVEDEIVLQDRVRIVSCKGNIPISNLIQETDNERILKLINTHVLKTRQDSL